MSAPLDFYFEFASPYGYLASTQIDALAARRRRTVVWRPIMLGAAFKQTGTRPLMQTPLKGPYLLHDVPRFARLLGVPLRLPPVMPMNSLAASRACVWIAEHDAERAKRLARALFHAHWGEGQDLAAPETVADVAGGLGIARDDLLAAVADPRIKDLLNPGDRRRFITHPDRIGQCGVVGIAQRFAEIPQRGLQPPDLLRQRLQSGRRR